MQHVRVSRAPSAATHHTHWLARENHGRLLPPFGRFWLFGARFVPLIGADIGAAVGGCTSLIESGVEAREPKQPSPSPPAEPSTGMSGSSPSLSSSSMGPAPGCDAARLSHCSEAGSSNTSSDSSATELTADSGLRHHDMSMQHAKQRR